MRSFQKGFGYQAKEQGLHLKGSGAYDMDNRQDGVVL